MSVLSAKRKQPKTAKNAATRKASQKAAPTATGEIVLYREFSRSSFPRRISYSINDDLHGHLGPLIDYRRGKALVGSYDLTVRMGADSRTVPSVKVRSGETCFIRVTGTRGRPSAGDSNGSSGDAQQGAPFATFVERVPTKELADHLNRSLSISGKLLRDSLLPLIMLPVVVAFLFALPPTNWIGIAASVLLYAPVVWCWLRVRKVRARIAANAAEGLADA